MATPAVKPFGLQHGYIIDAPGFCLRRTLAAGVAETVVVPSEANHVFFSCSADFYVSYSWDGEATVVATSSGDVTDGSASELNPGARCITGVTALSLISDAAAVVTMIFYA